MKHKVFAIFDSAAAAFLPPWTCPTEAMALRHLMDLQKAEPNHAFVRHAEHYTLFELGTLDDATGVLSDVKQEAVRNLHVLFAGRTGPWPVVDLSSATPADIAAVKESFDAA